MDKLIVKDRGLLKLVEVFMDYADGHLSEIITWNDLMPIVERINDFDNQANIETAKLLYIFKDYEDVNIFHTSIFCHLKEVWNRVIVFIKWYNQNNQ